MEDAYTVTGTTKDSNYLYWPVSDDDLEYAGIGAAEVVCTYSGSVAKSVVYQVQILPSVSEMWGLSAPWQNYIDDYEGFSYRGKRITDFGLNYVPSVSDLGTFTSKYRVEAENPDAMNGGFWFGTNIEPRVFTLNCLYEDMPDTVMFDVLRWFDRRTEGEFIFGNRPYAIYTARPTKEIVFSDYPHRDYNGQLVHTGTCAIELTAYYPFAKVAVPYIPSAVTSNELAMAEQLVSHELMVLPEDKMPAAPTTSSSSFLMYNCGTEYAHTVLKVAGNGTVTFTNQNTGQVCSVTMTMAGTTSVSKWVEMDSLTGRTYLASSSSKTLDYSYHDYGYITIAPCSQYVRNVDIQTTANSAVITSEAGAFAPWMVGMYVYVASGWHRITAVSSATSATIDQTMNSASAVTTDIVVMNRITVGGTGTLTKLEMTCVPAAR